MSLTVSWASVAAGDTDKEIPAVEPYLQLDIWGSEAVRQSGRDSLQSHHIPTESWEDSGHPCSEIPLIHRSGRLKETDTFSLTYTLA